MIEILLITAAGAAILISLGLYSTKSADRVEAVKDNKKVIVLRTAKESSKANSASDAASMAAVGTGNVFGSIKGDEFASISNTPS